MEQGLKRKNEQSHYERRSGTFKETCIPDNVFPLGENVFVTASIYRGKVTIHVRRYKQFDDTLYPSTDGITMRPEDFVVFVASSDPPENSFDVVEFNHKMQGEISIELRDDSVYVVQRKITCRSGCVYRYFILLTYHQWLALLEKRDAISALIVNLRFDGLCFKNYFKEVTTYTVMPSSPQTLEKAEAFSYMRSLLQESLNEEIALKRHMKPAIMSHDDEPSSDNLCITSTSPC